MKRTVLTLLKPLKAAAFVVLCSGVLAACSDSAIPTESLETSAAAPVSAQAAGQYLLTFKGNRIPADLTSQVEALGGKVIFAHEPTGFAYVGGLSGTAAAQLKGRSKAAELQSDAVYTLEAPAAAVQLSLDDVGATSQANPATALRYSFQWNMRAIGADKAWAAGKLGSSAVTVAILDSGLDYDIRDLNGLVDLSRSASFIPEEDTLAKYFPAFANRHPVQDLNGHGTNVATQVSSQAFALAGITSRTTLMGVKVLGANGSGSFGAIFSGILYAVDNGADVINMSLGASFAKAGNGRFLSQINRVLNYAKQNNVLVVVSAGNESTDLDHNGNEFKAFCDAPHVVCVSAVGPELATGPADVPSYYTNFGRSAITVAAPGGNASADSVTVWPWGPHIASFVWSFCSKTSLDSDDETGVILGSSGCESGGRLTGMIGTSQAAPHVAGLAALLMAEHGTGNPNQIKQLIVKSADDLGQRSTDPFFGRGRINVASALGL